MGKHKRMKAAAAALAKVVREEYPNQPNSDEAFILDEFDTVILVSRGTAAAEAKKWLAKIERELMPRMIGGAAMHSLPAPTSAPGAPTGAPVHPALGLVLHAAGLRLALPEGRGWDWKAFSDRCDACLKMWGGPRLCRRFLVVASKALTIQETGGVESFTACDEYEPGRAGEE